MRFKGLSLLPAIIAAVGLVALPTSSASADVVTTLPLPNVYQMVVDSAHGHLFFSEGTPLGIDTAGASAILVTDLDGNPVETITGQDGVKGLALSPDGSTLYAALSSDDEIRAISTTTLKQTASYSTDGDTPWNLDMQDGTLWVGYRDGPDGWGGIGYINLNEGDPTFTDPGLAGNGGLWRFAPYIAGDPDSTGASSTTGTLVASSPGSSPTTVYRYDISGSTVTSSASMDTYSCDPEYGLGVLPGGAQFECGDIYNSSDLSATGQSYLGGEMAIAPNGTVGTGGSSWYDSSEAGAYVYPAGSMTSMPPNGYTLSSSANTVTTNLGWSADSSELFTVVAQESSVVSFSGFTLHTLYPPLSSSGITLNGPSSAKGGQTLTLTGTLTWASGAVPSGTKVTVTRAQTGSTTTKTLTGTTGTDGAFKITDVPPSSGTFTYTANYAGSTTIAPATSTPRVTVTVAKATPSLALATSASTVAYGARFTITVTLGKTDTNHGVSIYETPAGGAKKLITSGTVNSKGQYAVATTLGQSASYTAAFTGDAQYAAATTGAKTVNVDAKVSEAISGYYTSQISGTIEYRLYRYTGKVKDSATVAPNKHGECVKFEVQRYSDGAWKAYTTTGCADLNSSSAAATTLTLTKYPTASKYRVRADYDRSSTDTKNLSTDSGWQYFIVEK